MKHPYNPSVMEDKDAVTFRKKIHKNNNKKRVVQIFNSIYFLNHKKITFVL